MPADDVAMLQVIAPDGATRLTDGDVTDVGVDDDRLLAMHRWMVFSRIFDDKMLALQRSGQIGFYGEVRGQEASVVGTGMAFDADDWVFPALREGLIMLMRGFPLETFIAANIGNEADVMKGRQMPCHYSGRAVNQVSWGSCMATQLLHATGAAYAAKIKGHDRVFVGYVGDGGTSENDFHAALNFAGVHKLPNVFIVQNNQWAISVPGHLQTASKSYAVKGVAYGIEGVRVDGNDVLAVFAATRQAMEKARRGDGPTLIETVTFRMGGHSSSDDPTRYRSAELMAEWQAKDPIKRFEAFLEAMGLLDESSRAAVYESCKAEIDVASKAALNHPGMATDTLFDDVWDEPDGRLMEQRDDMRRLIDAYGVPEGH